ncbi:MAG: histidinol-phosphatase HisJ family protein [Candidatus Dormibacteria bacterium]
MLAGATGTMGRDIQAPVAADLHVHSEWSWDAALGSMEKTCAQATELGLKAVAFTEHADYSPIAAGAKLDIDGYRDSLARCQRLFPHLQLWSGVELGEPHRFPRAAADVLARGSFDLVLGSVHCIVADERMVDCSTLGSENSGSPDQVLREYFREMLRLLATPLEFHVLAHLEYPKRYWPPGVPDYRSEDYRSEIQAVLELASARGIALELNTTRGIDPGRGLCPSPQVLRWWREAGGRLVSIGSDAHQPEALGGGFQLALAAAEAAGFRTSEMLAAAPPPLPTAAMLSLQ